MKTKLILNLDREVIKKAEKYAAAQKMSLSEIVEAYLLSLACEEKNGELEISPFLKSMATGIKVPRHLDYKKEYSDHLEKKYK